LYVSQGECGVGGVPGEPGSEPAVLIVAAAAPARLPMLPVKSCFCKSEKPRLPSELLRRLDDPGLEGLILPLA